MKKKPPVSDAAGVAELITPETIKLKRPEGFKGKIVTATFNPKNETDYTARALQYAGAKGQWAYGWVLSLPVDHPLHGQWAMCPMGQPMCPFKWCPEEDLEIEQELPR